LLDEIGSTGAYALSRHQAPDWMQHVQPITGVRLDFAGGPRIESTGMLSTGAIHGTVLVERTHIDGPVDRRFRYSRYLIARVEDGRVYQAGPHNDPIGVRHHEPARSTLITALYACSTSTGW
jgi:hypothetical protein